MATELRRKMVEDMKLAGFSERTQDAYVRAVRQAPTDQAPRPLTPPRSIQITSPGPAAS